MLMKISSAIALVALTGCAGPLNMLASYYDHNDPCQSRAELNRPQGYQVPNWCGSGSSKTYIYNNKGQPMGYIKQ